MNGNEKPKPAAEPSNFDPYQLYIKRASRDDRMFVKECNESMDTMMVFAGLFSAAITQFIASTYSLLQPDTQGRANDLMVALIMVTKNPSTTDISDITSFVDFQPSIQAIAINCLFFFSLILSLLAALGAMLVKQMARRYEIHGASQILPWKKARMREKKRLAFARWNVEEVIAFIPMLLHIALVLFLIGTIIWTSLINSSSMILSTILVALAGLPYFLLAAAPSISDDAPFQWPASSGFTRLFRGIRWLRRRMMGHPVSSLPAPTWRVSSPFGSIFRPRLGKFKRRMSRLDVEKGPEAVAPADSSPDPFAADVVQRSITTPPTVDIQQSDPLNTISANTMVVPIEKPEGVESRDGRTSTLPAIDTGMIQFTTTPSDVTQSQREQVHPPSYELLDALVLVNLIRETDVYQELESIFQTLRTAVWGDLRVGDVLASHGEIILHRCATLAATTWYQLGASPSLKEEMEERARQTCLFVEWFYYQLTAQQRRELKNWPHPGVAEGLICDMWEKEPNYLEVPLNDLLLGTSVITKLHHVQLAVHQVCDRCIVATKRGKGDIRLRMQTPDFFREDGTFDFHNKFEEVFVLQAQLTACLASDTDCLLHYVGSLTEDELEKRIEATADEYAFSIKKYIRVVGIEVAFLDLRNLFTALEKILPATDPRRLWFTKIGVMVSLEERKRAARAMMALERARERQIEASRVAATGI